MLYRLAPTQIPLVVATALLLCFVEAQAQEQGAPHSDHEHDKAKSTELQGELLELRARVAKLEAALELEHQGQSHSTDAAPHRDQSMKGMGGMGKGGMSMGMGGKKMSMGDGQSMGMGGMGKGGMGMGGKKMSMGDGQSMGMGGMGMGGMGMGGMGGKKMSMGGGQSMGMGGMSMGGMGGQKMSMGMRMMGGRGLMAASEKTAVRAALPGFPGASHLYHVGATGFFLDHSEHLQLEPAQRARLSEIEEVAVLAKATSDRKIDQAEQDLWVLTGAAAPDVAAIEAKAREIADLEVEQRIAFIRSVGQAAEVLTNDQRRAVVGSHSPPAPTSSPETRPAKD